MQIFNKKEKGNSLNMKTSNLFVENFKINNFFHIQRMIEIIITINDGPLKVCKDVYFIKVYKMGQWIIQGQNVSLSNKHITSSQNIIKRTRKISKNKNCVDVVNAI